MFKLNTRAQLYHVAGTPASQAYITIWPPKQYNYFLITLHSDVISFKSMIIIPCFLLHLAYSVFCLFYMYSKTQIKMPIREDDKSPNLNVNDKQYCYKLPT